MGMAGADAGAPHSISTESPSAAGFLSTHVSNPETQWSLGSFGAIAEFLRDADEPAELNPHLVVTARGALRIEPRDDMRLFAFEAITRDSWSPRVAICLPHEAAQMNGRSLLTELGPDHEACRPEDRESILFDVGIGAWQVDTCIRVSDPVLAAQLRRCCGQETFGPGSQAGSLILAHSPHRVFISRIGRIEVFQPIPPPHGKSPEGPHTHVLVDLLRHRRTHAATEPIPSGWVPCAHLYPAHPAKDAMGVRQPFDARRQAAVDAILMQFGDPQFVELKDDVRNAVAGGLDPSRISVSGRFARTNIRVALRQLRDADEGLPSLGAWLSIHDASAARQTDEEHHIHHR